MKRRDLSGPLSADGRSPATKGLVNGYGQATSANDSISTSERRSIRITVNRAVTIAAQLGDRDLEVLNLLSRTHLASGQQIRRVIWGEGPSNARQSRRQLARLTDLRVVARLTRSIGGKRNSEGFLYRLDVTGQYICDGQDSRRRRPWTPGLAFIDHALAVSECYVKLNELNRIQELQLLDFKAEPDCWYKFQGAAGQTVTLKPDAFALIDVDEFQDRWWLEIDRATENPGRIHRKALVYVDLWKSGNYPSTFPRVLWVVPDDRRLRQIMKVLSELDSRDWSIFQVCTVSEFSNVIQAGAGEIANEPWKEGNV